MPCIDASGELTEKGRAILAALSEPASMESVAKRTGLPLYQVRAAVREMEEAGMVKQSDAGFVATAARPGGAQGKPET
jgi:DNA-binding IclR family transcriptional regulator